MERLKIAVVCIGDELLKGFTVNTNLTDMGKTLLQYGYVINNAVVIPDIKEVIEENMRTLLKGGMDVIIFSGGLGPTVDDLTKPAIAEACGLKLVRNNKIAEDLESYWKHRGKKMPDTVMNQALVPEGADYFLNTVGTAPGLLIKPDLAKLELNISTKKRSSVPPAVILLPGPPSELNPMFIKDVIPYIQSLSGYSRTYTNTIFVTGIPESVVEEKTLPLIRNSDFSIAYCASPEAVKVYISGNDKTQLASKTQELRNILREYALPDQIRNSVHALIDLCKKNRLTISVAESCTGGLIAAAITDIPGASEVFKGSIVSYSNEWKEKLLGVSEQTLEEFGAVSRECAEEMVVNLCNKYKTDVGISVTGIAGPGGGSPAKPIGLVYIGIQYPQLKEAINNQEKSVNKTDVREFNFNGNRSRIRQRTLYTACSLLRTELKRVVKNIL